MRLTESQIDVLLRQRSISEEWPWSTNDETIIDKNIRDIVAEVRRKARVEDKTEFNHYGSGYASFVDCWLYRPTDEFRYCPGNNYHGLVVLFSRLSPFYVVGEGDKSWDGSSGASCLPAFEFLDVIEHPSVKELVRLVVPVLDARGLTRLHVDDLSPLLPSGVPVPSIMAERVFRHFDALFYWED
ncbi:MAG: hypothetical protein ACKVP0_22980 [Pirellulaceae bacterium]